MEKEVREVRLHHYVIRVIHHIVNPRFLNKMSTYGTWRALCVWPSRSVNEWLDSNLLAEIDELEDQQKTLEVGPEP